jgi:hypothetical protein
MKTIFFSIAFVTCFCLNVFSQNIYSDVSTLAKLESKKTPSGTILFTLKDTILLSAIFRNYAPSINTYKGLVNFFHENPFIDLPDDNSQSSTRAFDLRKLSNIGGSLSTIGNLNVTNFADGLAKFLVERSKEELNIAFFSKFQKFVNDHPEVQVIFPTTADFLIEINVYQYTSMLNALRAAFHKDLNAFSSNLLKLRDINNYNNGAITKENDERIKRIMTFFNTNEGRAMAGALLVADGIVKGNNAADIINSLASDDICVEYPEDNFSNLIQLVNFLSKSLRSNDEDRIWITKQQLNELVNNETTFKIFLGLLYATDIKNNHPIQFSIRNSKVSFNSILMEIANNWDSEQSMIFKSGFTSVASAMAKAADDAKLVYNAEEEGDQSSILIYAEYATSVTSLITQSVHLLPSLIEDEIELEKIKMALDTYDKIVNDASAACYDIKSQNYAALVLHVSSILSNAVPGFDTTLKDDFLKYGIFMANVVEAQNSDEVKAAIEAVVLPVGSSSIKRETEFNVSLNSFIGPYGGTEYMPALTTDKWAFTAGLTAPIGIAVSWGKLCKCMNKDNKKIKGGKSFTLFMPVIDIGSLASFRMGDANSEVASEVALSNIISPGIYLYYGFGKCPISLGLGGQLGPQLRKVTSENVDINKNYYIRFGLNLVVDIPLFNLYTKN